MHFCHLITIRNVFAVMNCIQFIYQKMSRITFKLSGGKLPFLDVIYLYFLAVTDANL